jgi:hypothetical protein
LEIVGGEKTAKHFNGAVKAKRLIGFLQGHTTWMSEVTNAVSIKTTVLCVLTPYSLVQAYISNNVPVEYAACIFRMVASGINGT